jgi:trans-L-3-hydroxyproline dehydratase
MVEITRISVLDMHTCGEPVRIVVDGHPPLQGAGILAKRRDALENHDSLRRALMLEPRGHAGMYGVIPVPSADPDAVIGALFTHNEGYSTMCGHATIALGKWLVESGRVPAQEPVVDFRIELPCGTVSLSCDVDDGQVRTTRFVSVPSFVAQQDVVLDVPGLGAVQCDLAYGGAYYLILPASEIGRDLLASPLTELVALAARITDAGREQLAIIHPDAPDLAFLYGTILTDDAAGAEPTYNLCIFADGQIDRSPTGSGVTARMARDYARGLIGPEVERRFHGPSGLPFTGKIVRDDALSAGQVRVEVGGSASIIGRSTFEIAPDDPLGFGFTLPKRISDLVPHN